MELTGQRMLPVDCATAWKALNDPAILKRAIPGCETIEATGENQYAIAVTTVLGPVHAKFRGKLRLEDVVAPESYTLKFEGEGGPAGFAKGQARVKLTESDGKALLDYAVTAQVGGRIAQVGNRLVDSAARKLADDFFAAFGRVVSAANGIRAPQAATQEKTPLLRYVAMAAIVVLLVASIAYTLR